MICKPYVALTLLLGGTTTMAECMVPELPSLPNGASVAIQEMIVGQKAVKSFQTANIEYMGCLEKTIEEAEAAAKKGTDKEMADVEEATNAYNNAVSAEEKVVGQWNTELRKYKTANPG